MPYMDPTGTSVKPTYKAIYKAHISMYAWPTINSYKCCYFTLLVGGPVKNSTYNDRLGAQQQKQEAKVEDSWKYRCVCTSTGASRGAK